MEYSLCIQSLRQLHKKCLFKQSNVQNYDSCFYIFKFDNNYLQENKKMRKIQFSIRFLKLIYKQKTKKPFSLSLIAESDQEQVVRREDALVPEGSEIIQLSKIRPFDMFAVTEQEGQEHFPFKINFITNKTPAIIRKIPINVSKIIKLSHKLQEAPECEKLDQFYIFEQGQLIYNITINKISAVVDRQSIEKYSDSLSRTKSLIKSLLSQQPSQQFGQKPSGLSVKSRLKPTYGQQQGFPETEDSKFTTATHLTTDQYEIVEQPEGSEREQKQPEQYLKEWNHFNEMHQLQQQRQYEEYSNPSRVSLPIKLLIALIIFGIVLIALDAMDQQQSLRKIINASKRPKRASQKKTMSNNPKKSKKI